MGDYLKIVLPALIALIGTIIAIVAGYRQWKRQQASSREESFFAEKRTAYKGLWEKLEEVHITLRTEEVSRSDFNQLVLGVNSYILKHALFLDEKDQDLSNQYLQAVRRLKEAIAASNDERAEEAMSTSMAIPRDVIDDAQDIRAKADEVDLIRNSILERIRNIISGA